MNNPFSSSPDFRLLSRVNREKDEEDLIFSPRTFSKNTKPLPSKVFVLNLKEREDRWIRFREINSSLFDHFEILRFDAVSGKDVHEAIFQSFFRCCELCEDETFIIMEDDTYIVDGGIEHLITHWHELPDDWDVIFGNHYFFSKLEIHDSLIAKPIGRASTANFGIYSSTLKPKLSDLSIREDASLKEWDHFLTGNERINNFVLWPMISRELPGFSDHRGRHVDINMRMREHKFRFNFLDNEKFYESIWKL